MCFGENGDKKKEEFLRGFGKGREGNECFVDVERERERECW